MPWRYEQISGRFFHDSQQLATGYSGKGVGKNNPAEEGAHDVGPIPAGEWRIGAPVDGTHMGPRAIALSPIGHDAHGRFSFFIHGDNETHTASEGCIILGRAVRDQIVASADKTLIVISGAP